jgi:hypothetical protein
MAAHSKIGEFVAHDPRLQFGSLNHAQGGTPSTRKGPIAVYANTLILLPLSGQSERRWRLSTEVAIDPERASGSR